MRGRMLLALACATACSTSTPTSEPPTSTADGAPVDGPEMTEPATRPRETPAPGEFDGGTEPTEPEPFESEPVTPARDGVDVDDLRRTGADLGADPADDAAASPAVEPRPVEDPVPLTWTPRRAVDPDDTTVRLLVDEGDCDGSLPTRERLAVEVTEFDSVVDVAVDRIAAVEPGRTACPTAPLTPLTVTLDAPLGERRLLDPRAGGLGAPHVPLDDLDTTVAVATSVSSPAVETASSRSVADADWNVVVDCSALGGGDPLRWEPTLEYSSPELAAAAGADALRHGASPWHEFVVDTGADRGGHVDWVLVADDVAVGRITAWPGTAGWVGDGAICPQLADEGSTVALAAQVEDRIGGLAPTPIPVVPAGAIDSAGLAEWIGVPAGLLFEGGTFRFAEPERRCDAWIDVEDAVLAAGWILGPEWSTIDRADISATSPSDEPVDVRRQLNRRIDAPDGRAAILSTTGRGELRLAPAARREVGPSSHLVPCRLDGEAGRRSIVVR